MQAQTDLDNGTGRWRDQQSLLVPVVCSGAQQIRHEDARPMRAPPKKLMSVIAGRSFWIIHSPERVLWKTWNVARFPAFRHILGIGRWCIVRVVKPAERV